MNNRLYVCISIICLTLLCIGCPPKSAPPPAPITGSYCGQPGNPSIQLLPTIGLGVLRDSYCNKGPHNAVDRKPQLTIANRTNATLNVLLYGNDGTKYDLKLSQGSDNVWSLSQGTYRSELIIPGFPSMAGEKMTLDNGNSYYWEIWRSEL
jgi:hypothetical protein